MKNNRIAIFQYGPRHEEIVPSIAHAVISLGMECHVFINDKIPVLRGDIFSFLSNVEGVYIHWKDHSSRRGLADSIRSVKSIEPEHVIFSTLQNHQSLDIADELGVDYSGVVHNLQFLEADENLLKRLRLGPSHILTLSDSLRVRAHKYFSEGRVLTLFPHVLTDDIKTFNSFGGDFVRIAILGSVNFSNRDYASLLEAAMEFKSEPLNFIVCGGGGDRNQLISDVKRLKLSDKFSFLPLLKSGFTSYEDYFSALYSCQLVMPLALNKYINKKITSSVPAAIAFSKPVMCTDLFMRTYDLPCAISGENAFEQIRQVLNIDAKWYFEARLKMQSMLLESLRVNVSSVSSIL
ncbi:hypothetical protein PVT68_03085 [Microbulbifer bruguierae]|uniref:Glycosyltransferase n=1 Tax=Microbulbifer bruguierae TaxID=3029061 RepID=A0ABY8NER4_9GAMM|nr:hypothetical protein [Microbulbifer bruguierae]WGL17293.1 hypothetical protein PVT68_03085 [Microbulbifer bruguierae]